MNKDFSSGISTALFGTSIVLSRSTARYSGSLPGSSAAQLFPSNQRMNTKVAFAHLVRFSPPILHFPGLITLSDCVRGLQVHVISSRGGSNRYEVPTSRCKRAVRFRCRRAGLGLEPSSMICSLRLFCMALVFPGGGIFAFGADMRWNGIGL